jgi:formylglycine-generating enzyme required for sulfatase activity
MLKRFLLICTLLLSCGVSYAAEDFYTALEKAENWLKRRYDPSSVVYRTRQRKLAKIADGEASDAEKIAALKKEFPEAFSQPEEAPAAKDDKLTVVLPNGVKLELVKVEAGTFTMGARDGENGDNEKEHQVTLTRDFYIGQIEVTQPQYEAVTGNNPSGFKGDDLPVEQVSWNEAMEFCAKLNEMGKAPTGWKFTLPTEAQWEYAARGGKNSKEYKYSGSGNVDDVAWYEENSDKKTHPVARKRANELGVYDMSGNVWEWCLDFYEGRYARDPEFLTDNSGSLRVNRGGSWYYLAKFCRSAVRDCDDPGFRDDDVGFRVVLVPVQ